MTEDNQQNTDANNKDDAKLSKDSVETTVEE